MRKPILKHSSLACIAFVMLASANAHAGVTISNQTALSVSTTGAQLRGDATEAGGSTYSAYFEYGETTGYGTLTPTQSNVVAPNLTTRVLSAAVSGLTCGTQYHFRMVVPTGPNGADTTFSTTPCSPTLALARTAGSDPSLYGSSITYTATLSGATNPTGAVNFMVNGTTITGCGAQPVAGGTATCTVTNLSTGGAAANISATFFNDTHNYNATSGNVSQTVSAAVPGAPTSVAATAGNAKATVTFAAPASNGGGPITGYTVTSSPAGGVDSNAGSTSTIHTVTGLTNGTAYTFTVVATNAAGVSVASTASAPVTPQSSIVENGSTIPTMVVTIPGVRTMPTLLNLGAGGGPAMATFMVNTVATAMNKPGIAWQSQNTTGSVVLSGYENGTMTFMPHTTATGDTRANGVYAMGNGNYKVVKDGVSVVIAPALVNLSELAGLYPGVSATVSDSGVISASIGGFTYVVQPSIGVKSPYPGSVTAKLTGGPDGQIHFVDSLNNDQVLYPAFLEPDTLRSALKNLDPNSTMSIQFDGTAIAKVFGDNYTLIPDMTLGTVPSSQAGKLWWQDGPTSYHLLNLQTTGTSQAFTAKKM